jgi:hypothetical protein
MEQGKVVACVRQADVVIKDSKAKAVRAVSVTETTLSNKDKVEMRRMEQDRILFWI